MKIKYKSGFTLIELLVVCAIIAVIATLVLLSYTEAQKKSRDSRRKADLELLSQAVEMYKADKGKYPFQGLQLWNRPDGLSISPLPFTNAVSPKYIQKIPVDPLGGSYRYKTNDTSYLFFATLENTKDPDYNKCMGKYSTPICF